MWIFDYVGTLTPVLFKGQLYMVLVKVQHAYSKMYIYMCGLMYLHEMNIR